MWENLIRNDEISFWMMIFSFIQFSISFFEWPHLKQYEVSFISFPTSCWFRTKDFIKKKNTGTLLNIFNRFSFFLKRLQLPTLYSRPFNSATRTNQSESAHRHGPLIGTAFKTSGVDWTSKNLDFVIFFWFYTVVYISIVIKLAK